MGLGVYGAGARDDVGHRAGGDGGDEMNWLSDAIQRLIESRKADAIIGNPPYQAKPRRRRKGYYYTPSKLLRKVKP